MSRRALVLGCLAALLAAAPAAAAAPVVEQMVVFREGDAVSLSWGPRDAVVLPAEPARG